MKVHFVVHEIFEGPAAIETWGKKNNYELSYSRVYDGETLPANCDFDLLVVMGGPQSPATTTKECPHYDAPAEIDLIKRAAAANKLILGVCLGAQLMGEAFGGRFDHSPNREIGVFPVTLTSEGLSDPLIGKLPPVFRVGHWHGDMPGVPAGAAILATSVGCPRQIVRFSPKAYGFQCHFEFTPEAVDGLIEHGKQELEAYKALPYIESIDQLRDHDFTEMNNFLFGFLDRFVKQ